MIPLKFFSNHWQLVERYDYYYYRRWCFGIYPPPSHPRSLLGLSTESYLVAGVEYNLLPRILNTRRANISSTRLDLVWSASEYKTRHPIDIEEGQPLHLTTFSSYIPSQRRLPLTSMFNNIGSFKSTSRAFWLEAQFIVTPWRVSAARLAPPLSLRAIQLKGRPSFPPATMIQPNASVIVTSFSKIRAHPHPLPHSRTLCPALLLYLYLPRRDFLSAPHSDKSSPANFGSATAENWVV